MRLKIAGSHAVVFVAGVVAALIVRSSSAARAPREPDGFVPMYKLLAQKPQIAETWLRSWWAHRDATFGVAYAVIPREVPMHVHLDADHVMIVVEGSAHVSVGGAQADMAVGDSITVPRGMAHAIRRAGLERLVMIDVSTPPGDMAQTFWIETPKEVAPPPPPVAAPRDAGP